MGLYCDCRRALGVVTFALLLAIGIADPAQARIFHCGSGDVFCLIASIRSANERPGSDTIILEAGTYTLTVVDNLRDGANGLPSVIGRLTILGAGAAATIIERNPLTFPNFRILHIEATGTLTLHGITIQGGGLSTQGDPSTLGGAGIFNRGTLTVSHSVVRSNSRLFDFGGAIQNLATLTIVDSRITGNFAPQGFGGGIESRGSLQILRSTIEDSDAGICGGIAVSGTTTIKDSTISSNGADFSGGLCAVDGTTIIINTTIANNIDGGLTVFDDAAVRLINVTIADNLAVGPVGGGGILAAGVVQLQNSILARNSISASVPGSGRDCLGTITSLGNNIISDTTDCTIDLVSSDFVGDAGLGAFVDNGTPGGGYIPLLAESPAIDAANRAACPPRDQLGQRRIDGDGNGRKLCDTGAIEFVP